MPLVPKQLRSTRRRVLALGLGAGYLLFKNPLIESFAGEMTLQKVRKQARALGSSVTLTVLHQDAALAERAIDAAFCELELIESVMSIYRSTSQVCRLNHDGVLNNPNPHLLSVLNFARNISARAGGAFDITVQPLWEVFHRAK
ncbi:MAG: thiamine biosynthesis lipoprotein [Verrucomicrobiales bacterium]|jgi:thiamine biosynthesis lipoprotein